MLADEMSTTILCAEPYVCFVSKGNYGLIEVKVDPLVIDIKGCYHAIQSDLF